MSPRTTLADETARQLRDLILSGELMIGSSLRQDELATRLGVSRTPLREAIAKLSSEGLVRSDPHRGAVVSRPSEAELLELYEIREVLEVLAAERATQNQTPDDVARLRDLTRSFEGITDAGEWARLNTEFHMDLYAVSGRVRLCELIRQLRNQTEAFVRLRVGPPQDREEAHQDHLRIVEAFAAKDVDAVVEETRAHMRRTIASVTTDSGALAQISPDPDGSLRNVSTPARR